MHVCDPSFCDSSLCFWLVPAPGICSENWNEHISQMQTLSGRIWMKKLKECQKLSLIAFFRQRKTDTCYDLTLRSYEGRCEQRKEASATSTSPGFGRFGTGWMNPQSGSWNIKGMLNRQHLGWLQMLTHPQTVLTLPLSYHLCPSVLVPHCDHARRWGQTISVKERKISFGCQSVLAKNLI